MAKSMAPFGFEVVSFLFDLSLCGSYNYYSYLATVVGIKYQLEYFVKNALLYSHFLAFTTFAKRILSTSCNLLEPLRILLT